MRELFLMCRSSDFEFKVSNCVVFRIRNVEFQKLEHVLDVRVVDVLISELRCFGFWKYVRMFDVRMFDVGVSKFDLSVVGHVVLSYMSNLLFKRIC